MSGRSQLGLVKAEIQSVFPDIFVMDYMDYFFQNNIIAPETPDSYYYQTDLHFKPKGYWLWGQVLADTLISKKLVE
jgi:hypothetical protein